MATAEDTQVVGEPVVRHRQGRFGRLWARTVVRWKRPAFARARKAATKVHADITESAAVWEQLDVAQRVTAGMKASVRAYRRGREVPSPWGRFAALYTVFVVFVWAVNRTRDALPVLPGLVERHVEGYTDGITHGPTLLVPIQVGIGAGITCFVGVLIWLVCSAMKDGVRYGLRMEFREFRPVVAALGAVRSCGAVYGTVGPERIRALWWLAVSMQGVRKDLRRAHRAQGHLLFRSDRRKVVRTHVRLVVKCLNEAEAQVDVEGDQALPELVGLLGQVADGYADGRLGALIDEEKLKGYEVGRDWEALRLAFLAVVVAIGAASAGFLALSEPVTVVLMASFGVLGVALVYRKNLGKGTDLLSLWRPV
ncbi:hypothetical protein [Streptomyces sp. NPDC053560]|uniref:hypothetical protein n=1 Tax=Streptomyces sp. NPDC053560 TaxID=3365711 RepID=UPI0037D67918